jgi:hypothetical protein
VASSFGESEDRLTISPTGARHLAAMWSTLAVGLGATGAWNLGWFGQFPLLAFPVTVAAVGLAVVRVMRVGVALSDDGIVVRTSAGAGAWPGTR